MFSALKFRDVFAFVAPGIPPGTYAAGSVGGGPIPVTGSMATSLGPAGNYMDFRKWAFIATFGSASVGTMSYQMWVGGASVSTGPFVPLPATSAPPFFASTTYGTAAQSASLSAGGKAVIEVRGEYLAGLNSTINWIKPIVSTTGGAVGLNVEALAFLSGSEPARNGDYGGANGIVAAEVDAF